MVFCMACLSSCNVNSPVNNNPKVASLSPQTSNIPLLPKANLHAAALINLQLALDYLNENQFALAQRKLVLAEKQAPHLARVYIIKGYYYTLVDDLVSADKAYQKALLLSHNSANTQNSYGVFLCRTGRYAEGIAAIRLAIKAPAFTQSGLAYQNIGLCALKLKQLKLAQVSFEAALRYNPALTDPLYYLADINFKLKKYPQANQYLMQFLAHNQPTPEALKLKELLKRQQVELFVKNIDG